MDSRAAPTHPLSPASPLRAPVVRRGKRPPAGRMLGTSWFSPNFSPFLSQTQLHKGAKSRCVVTAMSGSNGRKVSTYRPKGELSVLRPCAM
jgi:hypothetical protein